MKCSVEHVVLKVFATIINDNYIEFIVFTTGAVSNNYCIVQCIGNVQIIFAS